MSWAKLTDAGLTARGAVKTGSKSSVSSMPSDCDLPNHGIATGAWKGASPLADGRYAVPSSRSILLPVVLDRNDRRAEADVWKSLEMSSRLDEGRRDRRCPGTDRRSNGHT